MNLKDLIKQLQEKLNQYGEKLAVDGEPGPKTQEAMAKYHIGIVVYPLQKSEIKPSESPPWFVEAKKYEGKSESDSAFNKLASGFWKLVGLKGYTSISGAARAWCGLFIVMALSGVGFDYIKNGAGAKNWASFGQEINWKVDGIPQGAIVQINHVKCGSGSSNHVAMANGNCTAADLLKNDAYIALYGGNQGNTAKVSRYAVTEICAVRWPNESQKPAPVKESKDCSNATSTGGSTR